MLFPRRRWTALSRTELPAYAEETQRRLICAIVTAEPYALNAQSSPMGGGFLLIQTLVTWSDRVSLQRLAIMDALTGLYNRRHFQTLAEAEWNRFQRYNRPLSILIIDIGRFKEVNGRCGHDVGDRAIAYVAES